MNCTVPTIFPAATVVKAGRSNGSATPRLYHLTIERWNDLTIQRFNDLAVQPFNGLPIRQFYARTFHHIAYANYTSFKSV